MFNQTYFMTLLQVSHGPKSELLRTIGEGPLQADTLPVIHSTVSKQLKVRCTFLNQTSNQEQVCNGVTAFRNLYY